MKPHGGQHRHFYTKWSCILFHGRRVGFDFAYRESVCPRRSCTRYDGSRKDVGSYSAQPVLQVYDILAFELIAHGLYRRLSLELVGEMSRWQTSRQSRAAVVETG